MDYKQSARSPHLGKLFAYDATGKVVNEFDMLKVKLTHENSEFSVSELLKDVIDTKKELKKVQNELILIQSELKKQKEFNRLTKELFVKLQEKLVELETKNTII